MKLELAKIRIDGGTQARAGIDGETVGEYRAAIEAGDVFPPLTVFHDGTTYWLADGFHRYHAYKELEAHEVEADVRQGARRDAVLYSVGANATHGLRRTNEDKRRAVQVLLEDDEWREWSNMEIARRAGVNEKTVRNMRPQPTSDYPKSTERKGADGRTINTANIGRSQPTSTYTPPLTPDEPEEDDRPEFDPYADNDDGLELTVEDFSSDQPPALATPPEEEVKPVHPLFLRPLEPLEVRTPEEDAEFERLASQVPPTSTPETRMNAALREARYEEAALVGKHFTALLRYDEGQLIEIVHSSGGSMLGLPRLYRMLMKELQSKTLEVTQ